MIELKNMNYELQNGRYTKQIGNYIIELFPARENDYFLRRIIFGTKVVDIKKVNIKSIEQDAAFYEVIKNRALATNLEPFEVQSLETKVFVKEDEVLLATFVSELSGTKDTEEKEPGYVETEKLRKVDEVDLKKKRGE